MLQDPEFGISYFSNRKLARVLSLTHGPPRHHESWPWQLTLPRWDTRIWQRLLNSDQDKSIGAFSIQSCSKFTDEIQVLMCDSHFHVYYFTNSFRLGEVAPWLRVHILILLRAWVLFEAPTSSGSQKSETVAPVAPTQFSGLSGPNIHVQIPIHRHTQT